MTYQELASQTLAKWHKLDPRRMQKALELVDNRQTKLKRANLDEQGNSISRTAAAWVVRSNAKAPYKNNDKIWYIVRPKSKFCQCIDSQQGNTCKHRLAVYLYMIKNGIEDMP